MVSKKVIASTLAGTKALGVSGALGWALGLFDGEGLENALDEEIDVDNSELVPEPELHEDVPLGPEDSGKQEEAAAKNNQAGTDESNDRQQGGEVSSVRGGGASTLRRFFSSEGEASEHDRKAVDLDSNLIVESKIIMQSLWVRTEDNSWNCQLEAITIERTSTSPNQEVFERQREKLEVALKNDDHKKQFVANCSRTRLANEKPGGSSSVIGLETENTSFNEYKFKESNGYFERLWTKDFAGVDRMEKKYEWLLENSNDNNWKIKKETGAKVKIEISSGSENWSCYISGNYGGNLDGKTFKEDELKDILKKYKNGDEIEKKKYLIRNCTKNKNDIRGLTVNVKRNNWYFDDASLEKISQGMYENPPGS